MNDEQGNAFLQDDAARNSHSEAVVGDKEMEHHLMNNDSSENGQMGEEISSDKGSSSLSKDHTKIGICSNSDRNSDLNSFEDEVSHLNTRAEALEADKKFLDHTINSLRNGRSTCSGDSLPPMRVTKIWDHTKRAACCLSLRFLN